MWKEVFMTRKINQKGKPLSMSNRDNFPGVDKFEGKEDGKITGKCFPVLYYTRENCHHICLHKINRKMIHKNKEAYLIFSTMGQKDKNRQDMAL